MRKKRILVIDDEAQVTRWLNLLLSRTGEYEIREENDSRQAVAVAKEFKPDMILSDIDMPEMDGGDVAKAIKANYSRNVPIVFLSSLISKDEAADGTRPIEGHDYLAKPICKTDVIRCIEEHLNQVEAA